MTGGQARFVKGADWDQIMSGLGVGDDVFPAWSRLAAMPIQGSPLNDVLARFSIPRLWEARPAPHAESSLLDRDEGPFSELVKPIMEVMSKQWEQLLAPMKPLIRKFVPPNWRDVHKIPAMPRIKQMLLTEGIPVMWVPATKTLQSIFRASVASSRRRAIMRRWGEIAGDCGDALDTITFRGMRQPAAFARSALEALQNANPDASQALSANLIDTLLRNNYGAGATTFTKRPKGTPPPDLEKVDLYRGLTLAPIWAAYQEYWRHKGDEIPHTFGRHPSAHAVCRKQHSRTNATIAAMLAVSLIKQLDHELGQSPVARR